MARKLIHTVSNPTLARTVKVYRDAELGEYVARLYVAGGLLPDADYFTSDKTDAIGTAEHMAMVPPSKPAN